MAYLSAEYLLGPQLLNCLLADDLEEPMRAALASLGLDLDDLVASGTPGPGWATVASVGWPPAISTASQPLGIPAVGYGIRYEYGIFRQAFIDGKQAEMPDKWLAGGNPWEFPHPT